ncbi:MAG TPA: AzlD domain-containing protein [Anaerolineae bacterium]
MSLTVRPAVLLIIVGCAAVTFIPRVLPLVLLSRFTLPDRAVRWLGYVPVAVLAALLAQSVLLANGRIDLSPTNLSLIAVIPALIVAIRTRSLIGTVAAGVAAMALLRLL